MFRLRSFSCFSVSVVALACSNASSSSTELASVASLELASQAEALMAAPDLIAIGTLDGTSDKAPQTALPLENGQAGNLLGGIGSGLAYAGKNTFLALPDRGPNAISYSAIVDSTTSYVPRFHTLKLKLKASRDASAALPFSLEVKLKDTTLLSSPGALAYAAGNGLDLAPGAPSINKKKHFYFSGRSDNFAPSPSSTNPSNGRFDPESIRVSREGNSVFVSDEYGPYVYQFERATGRRVRTFSLPAAYAASVLSSQGDSEITGNTSGRVANKGMEALAITPDGGTLVGIMQSPLLQDGGTNGRFTRIVSINIESGVTREYAYELTNIGSASKPKYPTVSDVVAVNEHQFLVDERDSKGVGDDSAAVFKRIQLIDLQGAADVSGLAGESSFVGKAVSKTAFIDVVALLNAHGIVSTNIPAKLEGLAFGDDVTIAGEVVHTLVLSNDNDFLSQIVDTNHPSGFANPNQFFVFAVPSSALPGYTPQEFGSDCGGTTE